MAADVQVTTELTGDREDLVSELRAAEQDAQQFVQRIGAMHAELPVTLNLAGATTALEAFIRQAQAAGVKIPITFEPTGGGSAAGFTSAAELGRSATYAQQQAGAMQAPAVGAATASLPIPPIAAPETEGTRPYDVSESGPYALKPKAEIGKEFARITATRNIIDEGIEGVEAGAMHAIEDLADTMESLRSEIEQLNFGTGKKGGGRGGAGGGRGSQSQLNRGLYRYLTVAFAGREAVESAIDARQLGIEQELAGNDVEKQYAATEGFIKKFPFTNMLLDPTGSEQIARQRTIDSAKFGVEFSQRQLQLSQATSAAQREAGIAESGGLQRERLEAENRYTAESQRIENERRDDPVRKQIVDEANSQRQQAQATRDSVVRSSSATTAAAGEGAGAYSPYSAAVARQQVDAAEAAYQTALRAINETQRNRNATIDAKLNQQLQAAKDIRDVTIAHAEAANEYADTESSRRIASIQQSITNIETRRVSSVAAQEDQFKFNKAQEIADLNARAEKANKEGDFEGEQRLLAQASAAQQALPELIKANSRQIEAQNESRNTENVIKAGDIEQQAKTDTLRGEGREREAASMELERSIDDRVRLLNAEAEALKESNPEEAKRLANLARSTEATRQQILDAQRAGFYRETQNNLADIREATAEESLAASGQRYQARERGADARFDRESRGLRQAGRTEEADAVEQEKVEARAARQALRSEDVRRIDSSVQEQRLRYQFRDPEADLHRLEEQHQEELFAAGGDPVKIAELNQLHQERLRSFARQTVTGVTQTNARSAYFNAQAAVLGDPTGQEARSRAAANAQARRELEHARPAPTPFLLHNIAAHGGVDGHGNPVHPGGAAAAKDGKKPTEEAMKDFHEDIKKFGDYVEQLLAEAV